jgi:serine protease Do
MFKYSMSLFIALATLSFSSLSYSTVVGSIVTIYGDGETEFALGSAVAITKNLLATNCQVALAGHNLQIKVNYLMKDVKLVYTDKDNGLCLIKDDDFDFVPVYIKPSATVKEDDVVYVVGNPEGYEETIYKGSLTGKDSINGKPMLETNASISRQSSGGGLFDSNGSLIGITAVGNVNGRAGVVAIPSEVIIDYFNSHPQAQDSSSTSQ